MNWEKFECDDEDCRATHLRYFDEATDEVVGMVSGPTRLRSYIVDYRGETIGEYRTSTAAMQMLERRHAEEEERAEARPRLVAALEKQGMPDPSAFVQLIAGGR